MSAADPYNRTVELLLRDISTTVSDAHRTAVLERAGELRSLDLADSGSKLVEDVQQRLHDERVDTTWPTCPRHGTHPLWYRAGGWWCARDGIHVAALGELAASRSSGG